MSTEPKLGTCDHKHSSAQHPHEEAVDCVNWREGESAAAQPDTTRHFCAKFDWCVLKPDHPGSCSDHEFMMPESVPPAAETARNLETAEKKLAENGIIWEEGKGYVFDGKS